MTYIMEIISERFSGYTLVLLFISSWMLLSVDRRQMRQKGLKNEAAAASIMGITCFAVAIIAFLISVLYPSR